MRQVCRADTDTDTDFDFDALANSLFHGKFIFYLPDLHEILGF